MHYIQVSENLTEVDLIDLIMLILFEGLCGLKFKDKVIGGTEVESNSWPWMVY